jgi:dihydrofolate synthase / folylpolyglutamate synthase
MQNYQEAIDYLYKQLPVYHLIGPKAYKADLTNTIALCKHLGHPELKFKTIHVAGTNGKGSSSHMLAAIFQASGYKTGLYTSPHLKDFTERIKVNGTAIEQGYVADFVSRMVGAMDEIQPSFFELTTALAFEYFATQKVDIAIIEVGLGGRLDSTNVIHPELSLITNIGYDHMDILGNTLPEIAFEKAGIIKPHVPVVISESQSETSPAFSMIAAKAMSTITFADLLIDSKRLGEDQLLISAQDVNIQVKPQLKGIYQEQNIKGVVTCCIQLRKLNWQLPDGAIEEGINKTIQITGLKGRWQVLQNNPLVIADTGHNAEGIAQLVKQVAITPHNRLHWVFGMVKDKNHEKVLSLLPKQGQYYFCQAKNDRAMNATQLQNLATNQGLNGIIVSNVNDALALAKRKSNPDDLIMVGGSTFVVAEIDNL